MVASVVSFDDADPIPPIQRTRGQGGVAMLWNSDLEQHITVLPENAQTFQAILLKSEVDTLIVNVYMPTRGYTTSLRDYGEATARLTELLLKYNPQNIIIGGDMNARVVKDQQVYPQDRLYQSFCDTAGLTLPTCYPVGRPTYVSLRGASTIDAFITNRDTLVKDVTFLEQDSAGSPHVPIKATLSVPVARTQRAAPPRPARKWSPNWSKCDTQAYYEAASALLPGLQVAESPDSLDASVDALTSILQHAATQSTPARTAPSRKRQPWNIDIANAMRTHKQDLSRWVLAGRPPPGHELSIARNDSKKALRRCFRQTTAANRRQLYQRIMEAHRANDPVFFQLIAEQRRSKAHNGSSLIVDGQLVTDLDSVLDHWATYFQDLCSPTSNPKFNEDYYQQVQDEVSIIDLLCNQTTKNPNPVTESEVSTAVKALNRGKALDPAGLGAEHLQKAMPAILGPLTDIFNAILETSYIPTAFQTGHITPICKKGKPHTSTDSYRGITVTSILAKTLEHIILARHSESFQQSNMQMGFTRGKNPQFAALLYTEAIAEALDSGNQLFVASLDARKAFDVVSHPSLKRRLYLSNPDPTLWKTMSALLDNAGACVKVDNHTSRPITISQGVGQGKILSTYSYKQYLDPLLQQLERLGYGAHIGPFFAAIPTCADDLLLMCFLAMDLQVGLTSSNYFSCLERYIIHAGKSAHLGYNTSEEPCFALGDAALDSPPEVTHLGILRQPNKFSPTDFIHDKISTARGALYSLMGSGMHGSNGLAVPALRHIYTVFVIPRLLYGLESVVVTTSQLELLNSFHRKILKQLQSLPEKTATPAVHMLIGIPPLTALLHIRILTFAAAISRVPHLRDIMLRQMALKEPSSKSWFMYVDGICDQYGLPSLHQLSVTPQDKSEWKRQVTASVLGYWHAELLRDAQTKSTLQYVNLNITPPFSRPHAVWDGVASNVTDVRRASLKTRLMTGRLTLQTNRATYSKHTVSATCPLCHQAPEDRQHFLLACSTLDTTRQPIIRNIFRDIPSLSSLESQELFQAILDPSHVQVTDCVVGGPLRVVLERHSRTLIFKLYLKRHSLLLLS